LRVGSEDLLGLWPAFPAGTTRHAPKTLMEEEGKFRPRTTFVWFSAIAPILVIGTDPVVWMLTGSSHLNTPFLPFLIPGEALCDEQPLALIDLAGKAHDKASVIYLWRYDEISHHSVCELYLDGAYKIFDPVYGYLFYHGDKIATFYVSNQEKL
jgi:hypothetical protein